MDNEFAIKTYRYLRIAMIAVIIMLLAAVVFEWQNTGPDCWQSSLSAYYYTPVQSIFVGTLITIGVCMVALRGLTDIEDIFMNLGGLLAPVVALVPTPEPGGCRSMGEAVATAPENIENNMIALFFAGLIGLVAAVVTWLGQTSRKMSQGVGIGVAAAVYIGGVIWFFADRDSFDKAAHYGAAIPLFVFIIVVVFLNSRRRWRWRYLTIAILMAGSGLVIGGIAYFGDWAHGVLVVEVTLIVLFAVFWVIQTIERWNASPAE
jgi:hypothetical protein